MRFAHATTDKDPPTAQFIDESLSVQSSREDATAVRFPSMPGFNSAYRLGVVLMTLHKREVSA